MTKNNSVWIGVAWKILSCACFAGINTSVRYLSGGSPLAVAKPLPIYEIMFFQNVIGLMVIFPFMVKEYGIEKIIHTKYPGMHFLRVFTAVIGIGLWYLSLRHMQITQVIALGFISPIITIIGARIFLQEMLTLERSIAIGLTLLGSFFITRPDLKFQTEAMMGMVSLLPICASAIFAFDKLLSRKLMVLNENSAQVTIYLLLAVAIFSILPAFIYGWTPPSPEQYKWLFILGTLGALAHYTFSRAYAYAEVTFLMPYGFAKMLICGIVSFTIFNELPKTLDLWLGITVITVSTIVLSVKLPVGNSLRTQAKL